MNASEDPVRLRALLGQESALVRGIEAARTRGPTDQELKALERAVLAGVAAGAATVVGTAAHGTKWAWWPAVGTSKLALVLAVGVSMGVVGTVTWQKVHRASSNQPSPARAAEPSQTEPREVASPAVESTAPTPASVLATNIASKSKPRIPAQETTADDLEVSLLERANRALSGSPALALKLAKEHARRFPASTLDQERELIQVTALVGLGRDDEARRLARRFSQQHPGSAYVGRIDRILNQQTER